MQSSRRGVIKEWTKAVECPETESPVVRMPPDSLGCVGGEGAEGAGPVHL